MVPVKHAVLHDQHHHQVYDRVGDRKDIQLLFSTPRGGGGFSSCELLVLIVLLGLIGTPGRERVGGRVCEGRRERGKVCEV